MAYKAIKLSQKRIGQLNHQYNLRPELTVNQVKNEDKWLEDKKHGLLFGQLATDYGYTQKTKQSTRSKFILIREDKVTYIDTDYDHSWGDEDGEAYTAITVNSISSKEDRPTNPGIIDTLRFLVQMSFWEYCTLEDSQERRHTIVYQQLTDPVYASTETSI